MKLSLLLPAVLFACSGADSSPLQDTDEAIVGGVLDRGAHPSVVAIDLGGEGMCSGTLVAPNVVLTARHCVSYTSEHVTCGPNEVLGNRDARTLAVWSGDDVHAATLRAHGLRLVVPSSHALCDHDVAAIVLDRAVRGVRPTAVASVPPKVGERLTVVGFGRTGASSGAGVKRRRTVRVVDVRARELDVGEVTCPGDSGGPALDPSGAVAGVVSRGRAQCSGSGATNVFTRADVVRSLVDAAKVSR